MSCSYVANNCIILAVALLEQLVTMIALPIIILIISLFTTGITDNSYCDHIEHNCSINNTTIKICCDIKALFLFTKPSAVYQKRCWCGGKWRAISVFCDTQTADGGWTVIQRRKDGSVDFDRPWSDYEKGFGDLNGEFWYGLKSMNCLTQTGQWEMRVDFEFENMTRSYLHYNVFKVGSATDEYPLTISGFTGITPTDPFSTMILNGMKFSTYDNENDRHPSVNCATQYDGNGGWWYNRCWRINLNLKYNPTNPGGFMYLAGTWYNPRWIEMKIRPLNCTPQ